MSRHDGVSCDSCLKSNFNGRRYKCLICYDYDLCADCFEEGVTSTRHLVDHPMQCILTRSDIELFFGGEILSSEQPQSFTCPYCKKMGFSDATLLEHVTAEHTDTSLEVVCPLCAGLPGGEPNLVTDDFAGHLSLEHRTGPRELISFLDEPSVIRHGSSVRRIPGRTIGGSSRPRRSNIHFSSSSGLSALSPSGRDSVDPIAELLSQLSGVRRVGPPNAQFQQLQMQIHMDRQQVTATRQQLERLPRRAQQIVSAANASATMADVINGVIPQAGNAIIGGNVGRANEWSVSTQQQSHQSNLTVNALNSREVTLNASNVLTFNEFALSPHLSAFPQPCVGIGGSINGNSMLAMTMAAATGNGSGAGGGGGGGGSGSGSAGTAGGSGSGGSSAANTSGGVSIPITVASSTDNAAAHSNFLLTKFMQPTLSDAELNEIGRERADRSQFVQGLLLSTLAASALTSEGGILNRERIKSHESENSDNVNIEMVSIGSKNTNSSNASEMSYEITVNDSPAADAASQTYNTADIAFGRQQVNQHQQTSPEDFVDEYNNKQQQQQHTAAAYATKKKTSVNASSGALKSNSAGNVVVTDKNLDGRRTARGASSIAAGAATGSQTQQQPGHQSQKFKQQNVASNAATATAISAANTASLPDTR